ncbi:MAG: hypothetical protein AVDCRST_MAG73-1071 [uncultured Thermomicrobiales bacterium]|uniref:Uncharacterized protein n=1 Tax=uncultured Thermomicrobiales bacterium TaxID=1645740 RepID=A0A6J4TVR8_9BACT|nr:MAG: hypothetical protein AVDCRST_MAG73-1071 [uncultured Thermomicrobiales bacterium]
MGRGRDASRPRPTAPIHPCYHFASNRTARLPNIPGAPMTAPIPTTGPSAPQVTVYTTKT